MAITGITPSQAVQTGVEATIGNSPFGQIAKVALPIVAQKVGAAAMQNYTGERIDEPGLTETMTRAAASAAMSYLAGSLAGPAGLGGVVAVNLASPLVTTGVGYLTNRLIG